MLCVPSSYTDITRACVRTQALEDGRRELFLLMGTGRIKVYDRHNNEVSCEPYGNWLDAPWPGYWSLFRRATIEMEDIDGHKLYCSVFSPAVAKELAQAGNQLMYGELATFKNRSLQKAQPVDLTAIGTVHPSYATAGSSTKNEDIRRLVEYAMTDPQSIEVCVQHLRATTLMTDEQMLVLIQSVPGCENVAEVGDFIRQMHEPRTMAEATAAQHAARRLAVAGLVHAARIHAYRAPSAQAPLRVDFKQIEKLKEQLPVKLTRDQSSAVIGIAEGLRSPAPMNALLCGDVGTGKTIAFALPAAAAHLSGAKVAIMAPTEILADQLASKIQSLFPQAAVHRVRAGDKKLPSESILVGTTGMATVAKKCGYTPNFMIVDEQHKMAVAARKAMVGPATHVLEASATPIPHALANTLYAGTQMLVLRQAPVQRSISSRVYDDGDRSEVSKHIRETIDDGGRVMIIYPRVNAAQDASVEQAAANLSAIFPGKVGFLHGKLPDSTVQKTLQDFRDGRLPMLVASTIVETGIDVPDVRLLIVREADRFGIAQLHQLRGRLARNGGSARFAMHVSKIDELNDETLMRLEAVAEIADGFALAEEDMRQRGFGDLLGEQQNGGISLPMRLLNMTASEVDAETQAMEAAFTPEHTEPGMIG